MGEAYSYGTNPFQDFLFNSMLNNTDISAKKRKKEIAEGFQYMLEYFLDNKIDVIYLDFSIIKNNNHFKVIGNNILTALWLSGIFPENPSKVLKDNEYEIEDIYYVYDKKTNQLNYMFIDE